MGFLKMLFGSKPETTEEQKEQKAEHDFNVLKYDGMRALKIHDVQQALRCLTAALELKDDLEVHDCLSQALILDNQLEPAMEELQLLAKAEPENVHIQMRMANVCYLMEDYDQMAVATARVLELDAQNIYAMQAAARAQIGLNKPEEAIEWLSKAIAIEPDFGDAYLLRADTYRKMGETSKADADADWLLDKAPDNEDVLMLKARLEDAKGDSEKALIYYNKVVEENPFSADALKERAAVKQKAGDEVGYQEDMAAAQEINPENDEEDIERKMEENNRNSNPFG